MNHTDFRSELDDWLGSSSGDVDDDRECAEELLHQALTALNEIPNTFIPALGCRSYDICSRIDKYFREQEEAD